MTREPNANDPDGKRHENGSIGPGDEGIDERKKSGELVKLTGEQIRITRYVLIALIFIAFAAFLPLMIIFLIPLILATAFTTLFYPFYLEILRLFRGHKAISSALACILLLLGFLTPIYAMVDYIIRESIDFYGKAEPIVRDFIQQRQYNEMLQWLVQSPVGRLFNLGSINIPALIQEILRRAGTIGTFIANKTYTGVFGLVLNLFITLFTMFYFFMDGEALVRKVKFLIPLRSEYQDMIFSRFLLIARATIKGTFLIGLIQGSLGAIVLLIFGVKPWLILGFVMVILSIVPFAGSWLVLIPAGIIMILSGHIIRGVGIIPSSLVVVSNIDNLIRPRIVGHGAQMHDLLIFFSTLGGLSLFGIMGFIIGPLIAAFFLSVIEIYVMEFQPQLESFDTDGKRSGAIHD